MVLELNLSAERIENHYYLIFVFSILYAILSVLIGIYTFPQNPSIVAISLILISLTPIFYKISSLEEEEDVVLDYESQILQHHMKALKTFLFMFFGVTLGFFIVALFLSSSSFQQVFEPQLKVLSVINPKLTGSFYQTIVRFGVIFSNNFKVMILCLVFSLLFGIGALFILIWNSSVLGVALNSYFKLKISDFLSSSQVLTFFDYLKAFVFSFLRFSLHGVPEIASYFVAGLAGSIISFAILRHHFSTKKFENIVFDVSDLIIISICILLLAAFIEVYITPALNI